MTKGIVPSLGSFVKNVIASALEGLEVQASEFGVSMQEELSLLDAAEGIRRLLAIDNGISSRTRWGIGDIYNACPKNRGVRDNLARLIFGAGVSPNQKQLLRTYGWVAGKWSVEKRNETHNWSWYLSHKPIENGAEHEKRKSVSLQILEVETDGVGAVLTLGKDGKKQTYSISALEQELEQILNKIRSAGVIGVTESVDIFFEESAAI